MFSLGTFLSFSLAEIALSIYLDEIKYIYSDNATVYGLLIIIDEIFKNPHRNIIKF
jgi:hypothetical protein